MVLNTTDVVVHALCTKKRRRSIMDAFFQLVAEAIVFVTVFVSFPSGVSVVDALVGRLS